VKELKRKKKVTKKVLSGEKTRGEEPRLGAREKNSWHLRGNRDRRKTRGSKDRRLVKPAKRTIQENEKVAEEKRVPQNVKKQWGVVSRFFHPTQGEGMAKTKTVKREGPQKQQ